MVAFTSTEVMIFKTDVWVHVREGYVTADGGLFPRPGSDPQVPQTGNRSASS